MHSQCRKHILIISLLDFWFYRFAVCTLRSTGGCNLTGTPGPGTLRRMEWSATVLNTDADSASAAILCRLKWLGVGLAYCLGQHADGQAQPEQQ